MLSFAIPGTVVGVAYILAFNVPPIEITGTGLILVICFVFRNMPVGVRSGIATMSQIDKSLDEASLTLGARSFATLRRIVLPLLRPAIVASLVYSFVRAMTAVSAVIFLVSAEYNMATTYIVGRVEAGEFGLAIAYSSVLIVVMLAAILLIQLLVGERRLGRRAAAATPAPALAAAARMSRAGPASVEFRAVTKRYGAVTAVDAVSFTIEPGTLVTLLGPSGCGKTTTLRLIAGLEMASEGRILIGGRDVTRAFRRRARRLHGVPVLRPVPAHERPGERRLRADRAGPRQGPARRSWRTRSSGSSASRAWRSARRPSCPAGSSSASRSRARWCSSRRCCSSTSRSPTSTPSCAGACATTSASCSASLNLTVAYVTHDQEEALAVSDRIIVMSNARIAQSGAPRELYEEPASLFVADFIGDANLVEAELVEERGERALVRLGGVDLDLPRRGARPGPVTLAIRPDAVILHRSAPAGAAALEARIAKASYLGKHVEYTVATPVGDWLVIDRDTAGLIDPGTAVWAAFASAGVTVIPA